ncbi:uncharacterized protein LOC106053459 isoform X1 [Biomphalaria glabrata]|uniref:Uncharacterized protein LOC106053459 isoform X1 n=1 Tax=Biomphalaria glabrata TaxID=6526 RepID=A0A9W3BB12_BIOGL|nr:uncharacterized protein LOC106053459 isoform X1 [Biomphalaria glabrata]
MAMELQNMLKLTIKTFDTSTPGVKVTLTSQNGTVLSCDVLRKVGDVLGLKKESLCHFVICQGLEAPIRCFKKGDIILDDQQDLSLQKWCFDLKEERNLIQKDPVATNLIFFQAHHDILTGKLKPTKEQEERLRDCLDPDFPADGQYIKLCQNLPGYSSIQISGCNIIESLPTVLAVFPYPSTVDVVLSRFGLNFISVDNSSKFTWYDLMMWCVNHQRQTIVFTFKRHNSQVMSVPLFTKQLQFMTAAMMEMLRLLQTYDSDSDTAFHAEMIVTQEDGSVEWTNCFYDPCKSALYADQL